MKEHVALEQEVRECITEENPFSYSWGDWCLPDGPGWPVQAQEESEKVEVCTCPVSSENSRHVPVLLERRRAQTWGGLGLGGLVNRISKDQTSESELDSNSESHGTLSWEVLFMVPEQVRFALSGTFWDTTVLWSHRWTWDSWRRVRKGG